MVIFSWVRVASSSLGPTDPFKGQLSTEHLCTPNKAQEQAQQKADQPTWHSNFGKTVKLWWQLCFDMQVYKQDGVL